MNICYSIKKNTYITILSYLIVLLGLPAFSQTTITGTDGTTVSCAGGVCDITTPVARRYSNFAVNTFTEFNAQSSDTSVVNLRHPAGSNFLVNRVTSASPAQLNTVINSVLDGGAIGGTMMFACPGGIMVGADAQVNVGSLILTTANSVNVDTTSGTIDLMNDAQLGTLIGTDAINSNVITFQHDTVGTRNTYIQNDGTIIANGNNTYNGEPASVGIFAEQVQNNGIIMLEDSGTPVLDGTIDLVTANEATYEVTANASGHHFVPTVASDAINEPIPLTNYGNIENAGQLIAREGIIHLASSVQRTSGIDPNVYSTVDNSGTINVDAVNPDSAAGNVDIFAFHNASIEHGAKVTNTSTGVITAQNTLDPSNLNPSGVVTIAAENIELQPLSTIDVTGINATSQSGVVKLGPSGDTGSYNDTVIGNTAPAANTALFINNDYFDTIDNSISATPPRVEIDSPFSVTFDGLSIQQNGLDVEIFTDNFYAAAGNPIFETISSMRLVAGDNINFYGRVLTANLDTYGNYDKFISVECQSFSLDSGAGIDLRSTGANYPIMMHVNSIFYGSGSGTISNYETGSGAGGILMFSHRTADYTNFELHMDSSGIDYFYIPTTTPSDFLNFSNLDLGTSGGTLIVGYHPNPSSNPFQERIIMDGMPATSAFDNGIIHLNTGFTGFIMPIEVSNADFALSNTDLIITVPDNPNAVSVDATTNNNFGNLAFNLNTNVGISVVDQDGGINIAPIVGYMFDTTINANDLSFYTPAGAAGDVYIGGNIGQIYLDAVDAGPIYDIDISTNTGSIQYGGGNTINGQNIRLEVGVLGSDINLYGNINSNNGIIEIINNNITTGRINIEATSNITLVGDDLGTGIEIRSGNELNIRGPVSAQIDTSSNTGMTHLIASAPYLNIFTQSGNTGSLEAVATAGANPVPVVIETNNFTTDATGSTPIITSRNAGGTTGLLFVDRSSMGNLNIDSAGIDFNGGGNDLLFENINLGSSDARFAVGSYSGAPNIGMLTVDGVPTNSIGSFNNAIFSFTSGYDGALGSAITINNADFTVNNQRVILNAPSTPYIAVNTSNTNFGNISIASLNGTANIIDMAGDINFNNIIDPYLGSTNEVNTLNVSTDAASAGNINYVGRVEDISAQAHNGGNINVYSVSSMNVRNSSAPGGTIGLLSEDILTVQAGNTVAANNIGIYTNAVLSGDVVVNGRLQATNGDIQITQDNPTSYIRVGPNGELEVVTSVPDNSILLSSAGGIEISGDLILQDNTPGGSYDNGIELEAATIEFDNTSTPSISAQSISAFAPIIEIVTDNVINGTTLFNAPPLIRSVNNVGQEGVLIVDRYTNGNIAFNNSGIDFNGGGVDLIWDNMNLGSAGATLFFGSPDVPTDGHIQAVSINGAPVNSYGSFTDGMTYVTALHSGASDAINVSNSNFAANNNSVVLRTINTPVAATYGINAVSNNNFANVSVDTAGTARVSDTAGGMKIQEYDFEGTVYQSRAENLIATTTPGSNGTVDARGDFVRATLVSDGAGDIIFTDTNGGVVIENANANGGTARIQSTDNLRVASGALVTGRNVIVENIPDKNGNIQGVVQVDGTVRATNGNANILTARGDVIISGTGTVEAYSPDPTLGNVKISKSNSIGQLRVSLQDGFNISAGTDPLNKNKDVIIGDTNYSSSVIVAGSQTGNVAPNSPYTNATAYRGPQGRIQAGGVKIAIAGQPMPELPPAPTPVDPTPTPPAPVDPTPEETIQEAINEAEYALQDSEGNAIVVDNNGEVIVYDADTGEALSLSEDGDNVVQEDFADDSGSSPDSVDVIDGSSLSADSVDLDSGSDTISLGGDDSTVADASSDGTGDGLATDDTGTDDTSSDGLTTDDSSSDDLATDDGSSDGTGDSIADSSDDSGDGIASSEDDGSDSEDGNSDSENNELAEGDDDDGNDDSGSPSGDSVLEALDSNDEPMDSENTQVMSTVFGICQGSGACQDIDTPESNAMLNNATNLSTENELSADQHGTEFIADTGYHPAGLEGFLMTLKRIEEVTKKHGINEYGQDVTPVFSYRHPKTTDRISLIENQLKANDLSKNKKVRLNRKAYRSIVKDIK